MEIKEQTFKKKNIFQHGKSIVWTQMSNSPCPLRTVRFAQLSPNQYICKRVDQTKREGLAREQTHERKTKDHELIYEIGLLQACSRRQIILKIKHCSRSSLNASF